MDPGPFFYIVITIYYLLALFTFSQTTIFYHTIRLIHCLQQTGEIDNLTVSWGKVLGCVVCRFHVAAGAKLRPRRGAIYKLSGAIVKLASINLRKLVLSPTGSINLGFILREDLLLCSSYLPLGVPNWAVIYTPSPLNAHTSRFRMSFYANDVALFVNPVMEDISAVQQLLQLFGYISSLKTNIDKCVAYAIACDDIDLGLTLQDFGGSQGDLPCTYLGLPLGHMRPRRFVMSTHASVLVDSVGPPSAEVCRAAASFP
jgi:hypothetical protein